MTEWFIRLKREWLSVVVAVLSLLTALIYYPKLPLSVPALWHGAEHANEFNSREWAALFPSAVLIAIATVMVLQSRVEDSRAGVMSVWRVRPWVRGVVMTGLWWSQLLTLDIAVMPDQRLNGRHVIATIGLVLALFGVGLAGGVLGRGRNLDVKPRGWGALDPSIRSVSWILALTGAVVLVGAWFWMR